MNKKIKEDAKKLPSLSDVAKCGIVEGEKIYKVFYRSFPRWIRMPLALAAALVLSYRLGSGLIPGNPWMGFLVFLTLWTVSEVVFVWARD